MSLRHHADDPWPAIHTLEELAEFTAWVIEARLKGALSEDTCEHTLEAIERRAAYLRTS